ncbi:hypothetical protein SNOG_07886 [Parastagonospora nodorum SN15]|uniref:Uncharacterized protein n=1 Tax=Phaeosphaeria nodorum (strain SN15 / ATCC MYA-4574 / FGSC 10173) TaxID=321614 RepID=Q0UK28_PHANO|nr:hypothetical protein SNOG_07886 [Parastagonospora nodorum SN15]EAT84162.1 hypothetical protein SNOG_07886 [Parastagonospora nodorum SN15]
MKFFSLVSAMLFGLAAAAPTVTVDSELAKRVDGTHSLEGKFQLGRLWVI